jgi:hypothetical protein
MKSVSAMCKSGHAQGGYVLCSDYNLLTKTSRFRCGRAYTSGYPGTQSGFKTANTAMRAHALRDAIK